jgi:hypothetical protein
VFWVYCQAVFYTIMTMTFYLSILYVYLGNTSIHMLSMGDILGSWRFRGHLKARPPVLALVQIGVHLPCG